MHTDLGEAPRDYINTEIQKKRKRKNQRKKERRGRQSPCIPIRNVRLAYTLRSESHSDLPIGGT